MAKKQVIAELTLKHHVSERQACKLVGLSRTGCRYHLKQRDDSELRDRLRILARGLLKLWIFVLDLWCGKLAGDHLYFLDDRSKAWVAPLLERLGRPFLETDFEN